MSTKRIESLILIGFFTLAPGLALSESISPAELASQLDENNAPLVLDVRSSREYEAGHVPGALHIPYDQLASRLEELGGGKDREIVVYCELGGRAEVAADILENAGYSRVRDLEGHMRRWRSGDFPRE
jgi:rhodanese-related sulfurtransferase